MHVSTWAGARQAADQTAVRAVEAVVEGEGPRQPLAAPLLVPLPVDAPAVLREPAPRAEGEPEVDAEAEVPGALDDVLAELSDLEHRRHAAPEELGHREVDAGAARRLVLGAVAAPAASRRGPSSRTGAGRCPR